MQALYISLFPSIADSQVDFSQFTSTMPEGLVEALGLTDADFTKFEVFMSAEMYSFFWAIVTMPFVISWGTRLIRDKYSGYISLQIASGMKRMEVIAASYTEMAIKAFYAGMILVVPSILFSPLIDVEIMQESWLKLGLMFSLILYALGATTNTLSVLLKKPRAAVGIAAAIGVGSYFIHIISTLNDDLENLKWLTPFYYYGNATDILTGGSFPDNAVLVMSIFAVVITGIGVYMFSRVDI